ncbi:MAG: hypothetical protein RQ753_05320 [Desulfurivibrionaceae bacterium]|nr:hypothetical protein [Desulfurivibrionaceae bacterium]
MKSIYYIGLDVHKKTIAYCIKTADGTNLRQGVVAAERQALREKELRHWVKAVNFLL